MKAREIELERERERERERESCRSELTSGDVSDGDKSVMKTS